MKLGLSTYAFFWQLSDQNEFPITVKKMLDKTKEMEGEVFQICDYPMIETMDDNELQEIAEHAKQLNIELELGTRGVMPSHLLKYLRIANMLDVKLLRTMFNDKNNQVTKQQAYDYLKEILPKYEDSRVCIAIETYEQVPTTDIVDVIKKLDSEYIGICLDPGNTVAALEMPKEVVEVSAPYVVNLHVKDFKFTRRDGWVGFALEGCPLGEGLLELKNMLDILKREKRDVNAIIELWLPYKNNIQKTIELEKEWTEKSFKQLRRKIK